MILNPTRTSISLGVVAPATRAALLTGRNHHAVGFGSVTEASTGYPGYDSIIRPETAHGAAALKENGYSTAWFGKNHNVPVWEASSG